MPDLSKLLQLVRKKCPTALWSRGVNVERGGGVALESRNSEEIVLRVKAGGRPVPFTTVLYPEGLEWECDCDSPMAACEHVAAAIIAVTQSERPVDEERLAPAPLRTAAEAWARVVVRLHRAPTGEGFRVDRALASADGSQTPLVGTLTALLANPTEASRVQPEQADLQVDRVLGTGHRAVLPPSTLEALLRILVGARNVSLDGRPVAVSDEQAMPCAVVEDRGDDVVVRIERDPRVTEVPAAGIGLAGDTLLRLGEIQLGGAYWQHFPLVQTYGPRQLGEVSTKVLPDLSRRLLVDVRSKRLPRIVRDLKPRIVLEMNHLGAGLSVLPTLVYGVPPCVRIDDGRMVHLKGPVPLRDEVSERALVLRLREALNLVPGRRATFEGADQTHFVAAVKRWRGDLTGDAARAVSPNLTLVPRLNVNAVTAVFDDVPPDVLFDLTFSVQGPDATGDKTVTASAVIRAWRDGLGLVPIDGGGWAPLPMSWLAKHGQRVADLLDARDADGKVGNHALPELGALCEALDHPPPPGLERLLPLVAGFSQLPVAALPPDVRATLRPYQQQGADWLAFLRKTGLGGILADDMGLGKTLQTIVSLSPTGPTLVVCPTSVLPNWRNELARFRPGLSVATYHGPGRRLDAKAHVVLTSYALMRLDIESLSAVTWDAVVLDEAQAIKNPTSQVAQAAFALRARFKLILTGTPIENRLDELWSLCHFTNRGLLGGRRDFDERFAQPIAEGRAGAAEELRRRIRPFILRRKKKEVAPELPPRTEAVMGVELDERERAVYDAVRAASRTELVAMLAGGTDVLKALEALLRLRQAACHPSLVPGQKATSSSKIERLVEALELAASEGHKALVFSQWTSFLDLIEPAVHAAGLASVRLDGSTTDREGVVAKFQADDGPPVMLLSLKAGGTGLNLTAADHVFLCDPWWNPAVESQAADRAHRIGQDKPVMVYRLVAQGTVEEKILELQERKKAISEAALGEAHAAASLTRDDLLALLE